MTAPETTGRAFRNELLVSGPAALVMFTAAYLLRWTSLTPGARVGTSFFLFVLVQALFRQPVSRARIGALGWAFVTIVALISASAMWYVIDVE